MIAIAHPAGSARSGRSWRSGRWGGLGEIDRPAGLHDVAGFRGPPMGMVDHMIAEEIRSASRRGAIVVDCSADAPVAPVPAMAPRWLG